MAKPSLDLTVQIVRPDGTRYAWGPGASVAGNVPKGLGFRTKRGDGFADASLTLSRRIDRDYVDLHLLDEVEIDGAGGVRAYEGRVSAMPRSLGGGHEISVQTAGWMAHAKDRKFREIYVDQRLGQWKGAGTAKRIADTAANFSEQDPAVTVDSAAPALEQKFTGSWVATGRPLACAMYDAQDIPIGSLYYAWKINANISFADADWHWLAFLATSDTLSVFDNTSELRAAGPGSGTLTATTANRTYAFLHHYYNLALSGVDGRDYSVFWTCLGVYGRHGLTKRGTASATSPQGFFASDMIRDIAQRWCPRLSTTGIQDSDYVIGQAAWLERIYPYDAWLELNRAHRWNLSVWEDKTLTFAPVDLTDYDWEVRLSDPGVEVSLQGDSTEDLANGIAVTYTDVQTMQTVEVTPDDDDDLRDTSVTNPANQHGIDVWTEITLSSPVTRDMAVQFGRAALGEFNQPKSPGSITIKGHVRDRAGHWQPVWKVRADDRIAITDHPNARPRLIHETDYQHDGKTVTVAVDAIFQRMDAVFDRIQTALATANIT